MRDRSFFTVLGFTLAYGVVAVVLIAAQPGTFLQDLPNVGSSSNAVQMAAIDAAAPRWMLASAE